jgi:Ca-activated chloride channel family protein
MNVANIMPGDKVEVELSYTELIVPEQGVYEFIYPAVVGPRYSSTPKQGAADTESWIANPYLHQNKPAPYTFDIDVSLTAGIPIQALKSPSHPIQVDYNEQGTTNVHLKNGKNQTGDRDYILRYQLRGKEIESGLLLYKGDQENFFLLMSQPPKRVAIENIPPREYIFVVDVSGSMHGFPLDTSKRLMQELLSGLRPTDSFNILFFSGGSTMLSETSLPVTKTNIEKAVSMLENQDGSGGTELLPALKRAMAFPAKETTSRSFVVITDGYVSVETEAFQYVKDNLNNANLFSFGIGSSINHFLIEGMARSGQGEPFVVTSPEEAFQTSMRFKEYIETPVLTGINMKFDGFEAYDVEPKQLPDLFAEKPLIVYGKWRGNPEGKIKISGYKGGSDYSKSIDVSTAKTSSSNEVLRYLWARNRIAELGDFEQLQPDSERKKEIINLGLTYNLLTAYTSFIAIDEVVANPDGSSGKVKQSLPLPKGVSDLVVGGIVPTTPEPGIMSLLGILVLIFASTLFTKTRRTDITNN